MAVKVKYVVPVTCHADDKQSLCKTTIARLKTALEIIDKDYILINGDVPYEIGDPTLGALALEKLVSWKYPKERVIVLHGGVGTFSEARITCGFAENQEIVVVSSPWYLFQGKPIWSRRAKENNIKISFAPVPGTGGWRTWLTYIVLGVVVRAAILLGLEKRLEDRLTASQRGRRNGFKLNGCQ